ncbi:MAG: hypothetical protein D6705_14115 [Deltaproteobacteria bacterium]|nr:MAG: hypothetical protein D6705_14115 [Deltaproteobacteria bacterium]
MRSLGSTLLCAALTLSACSGDSGDGGNVLPTTSGTSGSTGLASGGSTTGLVGNSFPATYRFECIDIQALGDAGPEVLQAQLLENQWNQDIRDWKLNILVDVLDREDMGDATIFRVRSGIGTGPSDLCSEPNTVSGEFQGTYDATKAAYGPHPDPVGAEACSEASTEVMGGSYELVTDTTDVVYIYAEDDDGTTFNCTPDAAPDAVPIRNLQATFTQNEDGTTAWGNLTGCLLESEAEALCSCLGVCGDSEHPNCGGCPTGSVPLRDLLGNIGPSQECTDALGAPAFVIQLGFTASLLPAVPGTCG